MLASKGKEIEFFGQSEEEHWLSFIDKNCVKITYECTAIRIENECTGSSLVCDLLALTERI